MNILVMGIGGLGGVFSAELIRHGTPLTLLTNNARITQAINTGGLHLSTPDESGVSVPATAITTTADLPTGARFDAVWLLMKATAVRGAVRAAKPYLRPGGYMVAFQNGLVEEAIIEILGDPHPLITSIVAFGGNMEAPGVYRRTTNGKIYIGELDGSVSERLQTLQGQLSQIITTEISTNIQGLLWGKLCWNASVNGLGSVSGYTYGEITATQRGRDLLIRSYTEVIDTARAHGIDVAAEVVGPVTALHLPPGASEAERQARYDVIDQTRKTFAAVKPSSLQSLERGRPTETEFLNGYVVKKAREKGLSVPLNTALARMIADIEAGQRSITPANLDALATLS